MVKENTEGFSEDEYQKVTLINPSLKGPPMAPQARKKLTFLTFYVVSDDHSLVSDRVVGVWGRSPRKGQSSISSDNRGPVLIRGERASVGVTLYIST